MLPSIMIIGQLFLTLLIVADGHGATNSDTLDVCDTGHKQSPIDVNTNDVYLVPGAQPFVFVNYNVTKLSLLIDYTVKLIPTNKDLSVGIAAGGIRGFYVLDHMHFHWGSEHTIDGNRFPLEIHFVHYNAIYPNVNVAMSDPGGLAVISVLYSAGSKNYAISDLIKGSAQSSATNGPVPIDLTADQFLPTDRTRFFRYHGSLTTPPCSEAVIWTVIKSKLTLSPEQISWFKGAPLKNGPVMTNFRPIQAVGYRDVELWITSYRNKGAINLPPWALILLTVLGL